MEYNEYLKHYGRLGQKWGVKNGPPYPLGVSQMSYGEKKHRFDSGNDAEKAFKKREAYLKKQNLKLRSELKSKKAEEKLALRKQKAEEREVKEKERLQRKTFYENSRKKAKTKTLFQMSDEEIKNLNGRLIAERQIRENQKSSIANGMTFVKATLLAAGTTAVATYVTKVAVAKGSNWAAKYIAKHSLK